MRTHNSSVNQRGQITVPAEFRRRLNIKPGNKVSIQLSGNTLIVRQIGNPSFLASHGSVPALKRPLSDNEMTGIAADEAALEFARENGVQIRGTD